MKKLFEYGNLYLEHSTWKDIAVLKVCLLSLGILAGCAISAKAMSEKTRKLIHLLAFSTFWATYVPLMMKFIGIIVEARAEGE